MKSRSSVLQHTVLGISALVLVATGSMAPAHAAFPGDNGVIGYQAQNSAGQYQVFTVRPDGTGTRQITTGGQSFAPAFAPGGTRLAVFRWDGSRSGVWIVGLNGAWIRRVATIPGSATLAATTSPSWAPDGRRLAYTRDSTLWTVNADGSGARAVLDPTGPVVDAPAWSPHGQTIAFTGYDPGTGQKRVYTVSPDGTGLTPLTSGESHSPNWAPDGTALTYVVNAAGNSDLWRVNADGTDPRRLTKTSASVGRETHPAWSPRGDRIVFYDQMRSALFTIAPDGAGRKKVRDMPNQGAGGPDWQPDLRDPSTITLNYSNLEGIRANGQVSPRHAGKTVRVELAVERDGTWAPVATKKTTLSTKSRYVVTFAGRKAFLCRLSAFFPGDTDHKPSTARKVFSC